MEDITPVLELVCTLVNNHFCGDIEEADKILEILGSHGDYASFGIECIHEDELGTLLYLNMGDTYNVTICVEEGSDTLFVGDWGSWYQEKESKYCQENNAIRCSWCSGYTPCAEEWRDTVCEHCNNLVGG